MPEASAQTATERARDVAITSGACSHANSATAEHHAARERLPSPRKRPRWRRRRNCPTAISRSPTRTCARGPLRVSTAASLYVRRRREGGVPVLMHHKPGPRAMLEQRVELAVPIAAHAPTSFESGSHGAPPLRMPEAFTSCYVTGHAAGPAYSRKVHWAPNENAGFFPFVLSVAATVRHILLEHGAPRCAHLCLTLQSTRRSAC